ncbi:MAG: Nif3-like dinuclear metal center hexameric protein [Eubacteriales bacterium]|nr:Nif3-like dinuclear metal center hexameric protein [Eubacteriales bacterium]
MTTCKEIYDYLNEFAPVETQEGFDNAGFLFGDIHAEVQRVLLALDATSEVIAEAVEKKAQLIVTHHPLIFGSFKNVLSEDPTGKKLIELAKKEICVLSMHTNLDKAEGGVNDVLIRLLGVEKSADDIDDYENTEAFASGACTRVPGDPIMRAGTLKEEIALVDYLKYVKSRLNSNGLRYYDAGRPVHKIACIGGAGGDGIRTAFEFGCDTYISADLKYSAFLEAKELGINLIDADHFCTENPVVYELKSLLGDRFPHTEFMISDRHCQTAQFV